MAEMKPFPLTLKALIFTKLNFEAILDFDESKSIDLKLTPFNNIALQEDPNEKNVLVMQMTTLINPERKNNEPYYIEAVVLAYFSYDEGLSIDEAKRGATITGHSVCYGAIREAVSWISGRLPYGPINLGLSVLQPPTPINETEK